MFTGLNSGGKPLNHDDFIKVIQDKACFHLFRFYINCSLDLAAKHYGRFTPIYAYALSLELAVLAIKQLPVSLS